MRTPALARVSLAVLVLAASAACSDDGGDDGSFSASLGGTTEPGDGDGDGDSSDMDQGDGDGDPGDGDGDTGDGDGDGDLCGNGVVDEGEECDVGNETMFCDGDCTFAMCGDGYWNMLSEECDDGNDNNNDGCVGPCLLNVCGDGVLYEGEEECDDENEVDTDACKNDCTNAICGDGVIWEGEETCEDLNEVDTDACTNACQEAACGDGILWEGVETCDDGNDDNSDDCPASCEPAVCGDGFIQAGVEECDDGNQDDGDGCTNQCTSDCPGGEILVQDWNGWTYWKVPVMGTMSDANVVSACQQCGLQVPCAGPPNCQYNNENVCTQTNNEDSCGNPMQDMSQLLCNNQSPSQCDQVWGVYQYMGGGWINGSSCGAEQNSWCSVGNNQMNKYALCVTG